MLITQLSLNGSTLRAYDDETGREFTIHRGHIATMDYDGVTLKVAVPGMSVVTFAIRGEEDTRDWYEVRDQMDGVVAAWHDGRWYPKPHVMGAEQPKPNLTKGRQS